MMSVSFPPSNPNCRAYKVSEWYAHSDPINAACVGQLSASTLATGGDDQRVNVWKVGKTQPIMLLCGGSRSGSLRLWDLSSEKLIRTLAGHNSSIKTVDFHPYGEYFASGSLDTHIKVWDIRKKACMQTYRSHAEPVTCVQHSPDGKWLVSGDGEGIVKVWDLTAGKLLHTFKPVQSQPNQSVVSLDFHPNEFLLAVAHSQSIVCWDMETFGLVSMSSKEVSGMRKIRFSRDGKALLAATTDYLRIWGWEPSHCYDSIEVNWPGITDIALTSTEPAELVAVSRNKNLATLHLVDLHKLSPWSNSREEQENIPLSTGGEKLNPNQGNLNNKKENPQEERKEKHSPIPNQINQQDSFTRINQHVTNGITSKTPTSSASSTNSSAIHHPTLSQHQHQHQDQPFTSPSSHISSTSQRSSHRVSPALTDTVTPNSNNIIRSSILQSPNHAFFKAHTPSSSNSSITVAASSIPTVQIYSPNSIVQQSNQLAVQTKPSSGSGLGWPTRPSTVIATASINPIQSSSRPSSPPTQLPFSSPFQNVPLSAVMINQPETISSARSNISSLPGSPTSAAADALMNQAMNNVILKQDHTVNPLNSPRSPILRTPSPSSSPPLSSHVTPPHTTILNPSHISLANSQVISPNATLIPSQPTSQPLNLNLNSFLSPIHNSSHPIIPTTTVDPQALLIDAPIMQTILTNRLTLLTSLKNSWQQGKVLSVIEGIVKCADLAVCVDILTATESQWQTLFTMEIVKELLPVLRKLLSSKMESYVLVSLRYIKLIINIFGNNWSEILRISVGSGVDLHREERVNRCKECIAGLREINAGLVNMNKRSGQVGNLVREVQTILQPIIGKDTGA